MINNWSRHSSLTVRTQRSANAFAFGDRFGDRYGVSTVSTPCEAKTVLKGAVNLASPRGHPVVDQEAHGQLSTHDLPHEVTRLLGHPF